MQRFLVVAGFVLLAIGLAWPWLSQSGWWRWIGRLPGDIHFEREGFSLYFPLMTSVIASIVITLLFWIFRK